MKPGTLVRFLGSDEDMPFLHVGDLGIVVQPWTEDNSTDYHWVEWMRTGSRYLMDARGEVERVEQG